jgi:mannose-1-phosphate guanylyltransferase
MAGGGGTRFWPRSRQRRPKQFLTLTGDRSLLQQSFDRVEARVPPERTWVITAAVHREEAMRHLPSVPADQVVGEPVGRDTAACVGLGAALVAQHDPEAVMMIMPADHIIEPAAEFLRAAQAAEQLAEEYPAALITFGIRPTYPAIGYGYIHRGDPVPGRQGVNVFPVKEFREKPALELAERYLAAGDYFWNSGIFVWKAATILAALEETQPALAASVRRIAAARATGEREAVLRREYEGIAKLSIDYAVMEHARTLRAVKHILVVEAPYRWDDVGSWLALERMHPQDAHGNTVLANHCGLKTDNCVVAGEPGHLIATIGVDNLLIIQDGNVTLVADRRDEAKVKDMVELLKARGLEKYL